MISGPQLRTWGRDSISEMGMSRREESEIALTQRQRTEMPQMRGSAAVCLQPVKKTMIFRREDYCVVLYIKENQKDV